jgi:AcrR family transcriptional regulator
MRADARRNYQRVLDAARKVFADQGGGASMEAIAKQAGVGVGTLYRHFPKRIDVVEAVYRDDVDVLVASADRGLTERDPWGALELWLRAYVDYARAKRTFLNELHEAFEKNPDLKPESRERIAIACDRVLTRAQAAGVATGSVRRVAFLRSVTCTPPGHGPVRRRGVAGPVPSRPGTLFAPGCHDHRRGQATQDPGCTLPFEAAGVL